MGANASTAVKRWVTGDDGTDSKPTESPSKRIATDTNYLSRKFNGATIFVYKTKGTMFYDEDGDLAHEFYIEVPATKRGAKTTMRKITKGLRPQGEVELPVPCINKDFPIVIYDDSKR